MGKVEIEILEESHCPMFYSLIIVRFQKQRNLILKEKLLILKLNKNSDAAIQILKPSSLPVHLTRIPAAQKGCQTSSIFLGTEGCRQMSNWPMWRLTLTHLKQFTPSCSIRMFYLITVLSIWYVVSNFNKVISWKNFHFTHMLRLTMHIRVASKSRCDIMQYLLFKTFIAKAPAAELT